MANELNEIKEIIEKANELEEIEASYEEVNADVVIVKLYDKQSNHLEVVVIQNEIANFFGDNDNEKIPLTNYLKNLSESWS